MGFTSATGIGSENHDILYWDFETGGQCSLACSALAAVDGAVGAPFKLKISGSNFQQGIQVFVGTDAAPWAKVLRKSADLLILKGGGALKAKFPKGVAVPIKLVNPDEGYATTSYTR